MYPLSNFSENNSGQNFHSLLLGISWSKKISRRFTSGWKAWSTASRISSSWKPGGHVPEWPCRKHRSGTAFVARRASSISSKSKKFRSDRNIFAREIFVFFEWKMRGKGEEEEEEIRSETTSDQQMSG